MTLRSSSQQGLDVGGEEQEEEEEEQEEENGEGTQGYTSVLTITSSSQTFSGQLLHVSGQN